jgi:uncharacterized MnhB-related membrane protein
MFLTIVIVFCAVLAMRAKQLLSSVLWLACASAFLSALLYIIGAHELAVIELSVGAGLVTILIVFVLNLVSESSAQDYSTAYRLFGVVCLCVAIGTLGLLILPSMGGNPDVPLTSPFSFSTVLWQQRTLDTVLQLLLIFSGSLGVLSLVVEKTIEKRPASIAISEVQAAPVGLAKDKAAGMVPEAVNDHSKEAQVYDDPVVV